VRYDENLIGSDRMRVTAVEAFAHHRRKVPTQKYVSPVTEVVSEKPPFLMFLGGHLKPAIYDSAAACQGSE